MGKSKYFTHVEPNLDKIKEWKEKGKNDKQICRMLGVNVSTFYTYKNKYPELAEIIIDAQQPLNDSLEKSLYEIAMGYTVKEKKTKTVTYEDGSQTITEEVYERYIKPEVAALLFAMTNRMSDKWQNRKNVQAEVNGKTEVYFVDDITEEDVIDS